MRGAAASSSLTTRPCELAIQADPSQTLSHSYTPPGPRRPTVDYGTPRHHRRARSTRQPWPH